MTYASTAAPFGALERYAGVDPEEDEIYVLRLWMYNFPAASDIRVPLNLIKSVGNAFDRWGGFAYQMYYDVRGVVLQADAVDPNKWVADVICTWDGPAWYEPSKRDLLMPAQDVVTYLNQPDGVGRYTPGAGVEKAVWLYLTGDEAKVEISHWLASPVLWRHKDASTTLSWQQGQNIWYGTAEQRQRQYPPPTIPGIPPPNGNGSGKTTSLAATGIGVAVIAGAIYLALAGRKGTKR